MKNEKCRICDGDELFMISSMKWRKLEFMFTRCLACSTEDVFVYTEDGKELMFVKIDKLVAIHWENDVYIAENDED